MAEEEIEYESDPEEAKLSLKARRRVASDDEDEGEEGRRRPPRRVDESDGESEGGPAEYEEEFGGAEGEYDLNEEDLDEEAEEVGEELEVVGVRRVAEEVVAGGVVAEEREGLNNDGDVIDDGDYNVADAGRKEMEPYAVPTAGAFYMHDDRFRDNAGGRNRRMPGGRKLWESKDDKKWGHDKFEEFTRQERHHEEHQRGYRGRYRGRGRNRGAARGYLQRNRPREGRGPRRYQPLPNNDAPVTHSKQSGKYVEKHPNASSGRTNHPVSNAESDVVQPRKQVASNLNIASPPFYPTGTAKDLTAPPHKREAQTGNPNNRNGVDGRHQTLLASVTTKFDSIGLDRLSVNDSASAMAAKPSNTTQPQPRGSGGAQNSLRPMAYQPTASTNQINRIPSPSHPHHAQPSAQVYGQQFGQGAGVVTASKSGEMESTSVSSQSKTAAVDKGKGGVQSSGNGKGPFMYGGPQLMQTSSGPGDSNFPTFLPVMQFGTQHPGGIGVPAVGMAFPGYVGQPQLGLGGSEMTWLPVLTGAAGALGATYCPPYIPVDGSYNTRSSGAATSTTATTSKETITVKAGTEWKPAQKSDLSSQEFGQKQKNPRRYTEMKFDH
ncbi:protein MLN51 homolog isoform X2 [Andrographis paniculata]|uniref:protein MLN51 homolog isoform X2 n=1 Tax=Andrographis paniculata TaxID=175694 RepID=UPI0021E80F61|nr:protein MLN51 homolog isoform X2 [Andrographis paniculata]